jgi:multicomponent Na+:H+ antiporter subunit E
MQTTRSSSAAEKILLLLALAVTWLGWSGLYKPLLLSLGVFSCALTIYLIRRMGYFQSEVYALNYGGRLLGYWVWLAREMVLSSLEVSRVVLSPSLPVSPRIIEIRATAQHTLDQAILGNSITVTPGTLTLDVYEGVLKVHCLTESVAESLLSGEMDRRVAALRRD